MGEMNERIRGENKRRKGSAGGGKQTNAHY